MKIEKGVFKDKRGWGVVNLQNGDKVFHTYEMAENVNPVVKVFRKEPLPSLEARVKPLVLRAVVK